ncbi:MAG: HIT family protein [archaeon]|jgi:histidine triad (HIT) family protein
MVKGCIFCKIAKGKMPCYKVYEDKKIIAFLDINPAVKGHTIVIPKKHYNDVFDCKDKLLEKIIKVIQKISINYKEKLGCTGVNILNASGKSAEQSVFHLHFHILPRFDDDGYKLTTQTGYVKEDLEKLAEKLKIEDRIEKK